MNDYLANTEMNTRAYDTVVVGLGKTGLSCVRHLLGRDKRNIAIVDSRDAPPGLAELEQQHKDVPVYLGSFNTEVLFQAKEIILSPGVSVHEPIIQQALTRGISVYGDVELFCQQIDKPVIAVTGSNGKSTVVTLVSEMLHSAGLKVGLGGNIGTPVLDLLELEEPDFYVLELSSFQLETVSSLNAIVSVILNISEDHMDRYPDLDSYAAAKQTIYMGEGTIVFNRDDDITSQYLRQHKTRNYISYGLDRLDPDDFYLQAFAGRDWLVYAGERLCAEDELHIQGQHNLSNALAALALGKAIGLPMDAMLNSLRQFRGLPHRCQLVGSSKGVNWYNDSKATNVGATCAAIDGLGSKGKIILIAGGDSKEADLSTLVKTVQDKAHSVVLIGKDAPRLAAVLEGVVPICFATSMQAAVNTAAELARQGDLVLLSPACASLDMFRDYQARGDAFIQAVEELQARGGDG